MAAAATRRQIAANDHAASAPHRQIAPTPTTRAHDHTHNQVDVRHDTGASRQLGDAPRSRASFSRKSCKAINMGFRSDLQWPHVPTSARLKVLQPISMLAEVELARQGSYFFNKKNILISQRHQLYSASTTKMCPNGNTYAHIQKKFT
jgi:hypothetical protein